MGPRHRQKRRSAAGMALGTQLVVTSMARWPPRVARSYPPFVTNETCQIKRREKVNI